MVSLLSLSIRPCNISRADSRTRTCENVPVQIVSLICMVAAPRESTLSRVIPLVSFVLSGTVSAVKVANGEKIDREKE